MTQRMWIEHDNEPNGTLDTYDILYKVVDNGYNHEYGYKEELDAEPYSCSVERTDEDGESVSEDVAIHDIPDSVLEELGERVVTEG